MTEFRNDFTALVEKEEVKADDELWRRLLHGKEVQLLTNENIIEILSREKILQLKSENNGEKIVLFLQKLVDSLRSTDFQDESIAVRNNHILHSIRILTRLMPFIFEAKPKAKRTSRKKEISEESEIHITRKHKKADVKSESSEENMTVPQESEATELSDKVFWSDTTKRTNYRRTNIVNDHVNHKGTSTDDLDLEFAISLALGDNEDNNDEFLFTASKNESSLGALDRSDENLHQKEEKKESVIGTSLIDAVCQICFVPHFSTTTLPADSTAPSPVPSVISGVREEDHDEDNIHLKNLVWNVANDHSSGLSFVNNRLEILRLMLCCLSDCLYWPTNGKKFTSSPIYSSPWIGHMTGTKNKFAPFIVDSLLNIILSYDPVGYGVPYYHMLFSDSTKPLFITSLHLLLACIGTDNYLVVKDIQELNIFIKHLALKENKESIVMKLIDMIRNPLESSYLPLSRKPCTYISEIICLLWRLLEIDKGYIEVCFKEGNLRKILEPILHYALEFSKNIGKVGTTHTCIFIIVLLSGNSEFGKTMNLQFQSTLNSYLYTPGSYGDLLIKVAHEIIETGHPSLCSSYDSLITALTNFSSVFETSAPETGTLTMDIYDKILSPSFLIANPDNSNSLFFILEFLNNIIQYHVTGHPYIIYGILQRKGMFFKLLDLSVASALAEETAIQASKRKRLHFVPTDVWFQSWKKVIPTDVIKRLLEVVNSSLVNDKSSDNEADVIKMLKNLRLSGLIPSPHPVTIRQYDHMGNRGIWLYSYFWGLAYVANVPSVWDDTNIAMFTIRKTPTEG